jgi:hypothetical protein
MPTREQFRLPQESRQLFSIIRRRKELVALVCDVTFQADCVRLSIRKAPFPLVASEPNRGAIKRLTESWHRLGSASAASEDTLYDLLVVLMETVPDLSSELGPPLLPAEWGKEANPIRATQAHPRAYRGTKYQPRKVPLRKSLDLRPHLHDPGSIDRILLPLHRWMPQAKHRLERSGYAKAVIESLERELSLPRRGSRAQQKRQWSLPQRFVQCIWPFVRWEASRYISEFLSLYALLDLEHDDTRLAAITLLIAQSNADLAISWGRLSSFLPAHRQTFFLLSLIQTNSYSCQPAARVASDLEQINSLATDERFPSWISHYLSGIRNNVSEEYLLSGFRLAARFRPDHRFEEVTGSANFPERAVEELALYLADRDSYSGWLPMALWQRCAQLSGLAEVIRDSQWRGFVAAAHRYFEFLQGIPYHDIPENALRAKWNAIRSKLSAVEKLLLALPATHQEKAVAFLGDWLWSWNEPTVIARRLPAALRLLRRLATPPFGTSHGAAGALFAFLDTDNGKLLEQFLSAPEASFKALERSCIRENDARLISYGAHSLTKHLAEFTHNAFLATPGKLFKVARSLGGVDYSFRPQIIKRCKEHLLFQSDLENLPIAETWATIEPVLKKTHTNPVPARLRAWLLGEIELSTSSLQRHQRVFRERLFLTRLDVIEESILEALKHEMPVTSLTKDSERALRLLASVDDNRRGLRRALKAYWSGDQNYLSRHPATTAWYKEHPSIPRDTWEHGISFEYNGISLSIESNPLEVLKLGEYAGSCLGIGGLCSYSAAAVLLDVNKQVVYGRNRQGKVVGRQLLAISDDNRLICFSVYPLAAGDRVKTSFFEYDLAFAHALGVSVFDPKEEGAPEYTVRSILSDYWWDDGSWDFDTKN